MIPTPAMINVDKACLDITNLRYMVKPSMRPWPLHLPITQDGENTILLLMAYRGGASLTSHTGTLLNGFPGT